MSTYSGSGLANAVAVLIHPSRIYSVGGCERRAGEERARVVCVLVNFYVCALAHLSSHHLPRPPPPCTHTHTHTHTHTTQLPLVQSVGSSMVKQDNKPYKEGSETFPNLTMSHQLSPQSHKSLPPKMPLSTSFLMMRKPSPALLRCQFPTTPLT